MSGGVVAADALVEFVPFEFDADRKKIGEGAVVERRAAVAARLIHKGRGRLADGKVKLPPVDVAPLRVETGPTIDLGDPPPK